MSRKTFRLNKQENYLDITNPMENGHYCDIDVETDNKEFLDFIDNELDKAIKEFKENHK